jgi:hypothetical protein
VRGEFGNGRLSLSVVSLLVAVVLSGHLLAAQFWVLDRVEASLVAVTQERGHSLQNGGIGVDRPHG